METMLNHPAVQGGIAPFLVAALIAGLFINVRVVAALALVGGVLTTALLTTGIQFDPLDSTRKIILLIILASIAGLILDAFNTKYNTASIIPIIFAVVVALLWITWPVISREPSMDSLLPFVGYIVYAVWMTGVFLKFKELPRISAAAAATSTGLGIGVVALVGSSALLGQFGLAFGAAAAAYLISQMIRRNDDASTYTFCITTAVFAALMMPAAVIYAKVPWMALPLIALAPLGAFYPFDEYKGILKNVIGVLALMAVPIAAAVYFTWQVAGAPIL